MHCGYSNNNSAKALPSIIKHFKSAGYSFEVIDESTPEIYRLKINVEILSQHLFCS